MVYKPLQITFLYDTIHTNERHKKRFFKILFFFVPTGQMVYACRHSGNVNQSNYGACPTINNQEHN
jgi:hypothetical protein